MSPATYDVVVIGGGVIGLSVAWRAAGQGLSVAVCDPEPGRGASWVAAGMLAPTTEARWGEPELFELARDSANRWLEWAAELEDETGSRVGLRREGTLSVALDPDDYRQLAESIEVQKHFGCDVELLSGRDCRELEPALHPRIAGGVLSRTDHQVDNRALMAALLAGVEKRGVTIEHQAVEEMGAGGGIRCRDGARFSAGAIVVAAGYRSPSIRGLDPTAVPVRPVKGQILRLGTDPKQPLLTVTVRAVAQGRSVYLVPRRTGELVVGATVEERGFDQSVTAGAVYDLLRAAAAVVPDVVEAELSEASAGLRPGSPDNGPLLGRAGVDHLLLATGHFRHGILLAPVTAEALTAELCGAPVPAVARPFGPDRFRARQPAYE